MNDLDDLFVKAEMLRLEISLLNDEMDKEEVDIEQVGGNLKKICERLSDIRNEYEVEEFLLLGSKK